MKIMKYVLLVSCLKYWFIYRFTQVSCMNMYSTICAIMFTRLCDMSVLCLCDMSVFYVYFKALISPGLLITGFHLVSTEVLPNMICITISLWPTFSHISTRGTNYLVRIVRPCLLEVLRVQNCWHLNQRSDPNVKRNLQMVYTSVY